ncbi:MAG: ribonuclease R, partial [Bacteroidota bacterium]
MTEINKEEPLVPFAIMEEVIKIFKQAGEPKLSFKQLKKKLSHRYSAEQLHAAVNVLQQENRLTKRGTVIFMTKEKVKAAATEAVSETVTPATGGNVFEGVIEFTQSRNAWVITPERKKDIAIDFRNTGKAFEGDTVKVRLYPIKRKSRLEGKVIEVVKRAMENYSGTIHFEDGKYLLIPDLPQFPVSFLIPADKLNGAKPKDKVLVKMTEWVTGAKHPTGTVTLVLGPAGTNDVEMHSILLEYDFKLNFTKEVLAEGAALPDKITAEEIAKRRDFRSITTFTIDPDDAKDFDDALSIQKLENGNYEIGIHIADVSHYSHPGTLMDDEAYSRATSVYLVDRTVTMYPERLSNELCSLRPNEDKLTFSAVFEMTEVGEIKSEWFGRTVIHSDKRFTYEEAQKVLDGELEIYKDELKVLNTIAYKLRDKRFKNGSINFDSTEIKFKLDANKKPIGIIIKERKDTHLLVEDFMLLANKKVAEFVSKKKINNKPVPFVYRVHGEPDADKIKAFGETAAAFGYKLNFSTPGHIAQSFNKLLEQVKGKPEQNMIESLGIRTMAKAIYTTQNIGHYGLAFPHYSHFTSPIRRYPDVMTHRILAEILTNTWVEDKLLEEKCKHSSSMEKNAAEAERASVKYKQVEFMETRVGEEFDALITGVTAFGFFAEI